MCTRDIPDLLVEKGLKRRSHGLFQKNSDLCMNDISALKFNAYLIE